MTSLSKKNSSFNYGDLLQNFAYLKNIFVESLQAKRY